MVNSGYVKVFYAPSLQYYHMDGNLLTLNMDGRKGLLRIVSNPEFGQSKKPLYIFELNSWNKNGVPQVLLPIVLMPFNLKVVMKGWKKQKFFFQFFEYTSPFDEVAMIFRFFLFDGTTVMKQIKPFKIHQKWVCKGALRLDSCTTWFTFIQ